MSLPGLGWEIALLAAAFVFTLAGTWLYRSFAIRHAIVANPNFRSLHQRPIPRGGGIVFSLVCISVITGLWLVGATDPQLAPAIVLGGLVAAVFGFIDDAIQVRALVKLSVQGALAAWVLYSFDSQPLANLPFTPAILDLAISWLGLVWLMNLYNFVDGIDGLAASGAIIISVISIAVLLMTHADQGLIPLFGLLAVCGAAFLVFNWPPASIFMGDAGSLFLGFCFCALLAGSVSTGQIGLWTWIVILAFFGGDTTTTTLVRMFVTAKWYGEHRSHAYQNVARLSGSHLKVLQGIWLFQIGWLLPLALWSALSPSTAPVPAVLAVAPVSLWALRYGPRLSSS